MILCEWKIVQGFKEQLIGEMKDMIESNTKDTYTGVFL